MTLDRVRGLDVRAEGVVVELGGRRVLDAVSVTLESGSFTALTGPSGAGKSTLLWVLGGAVRPTSGSVVVGGAPVGDEVAAAARGILLVPQGATLAAPLTARENVVVPQLVHRVPARDAGARADAALRAVRLEDQSDHLVEELSGGQQQRVTLARTLALRPAVLLADEPTSELDAGTARPRRRPPRRARRGRCDRAARHPRPGVRRGRRRRAAPRRGAAGPGPLTPPDTPPVATSCSRSGAPPVRCSTGPVAVRVVVRRPSRGRRATMTASSATPSMVPSLRSPSRSGPSRTRGTHTQHA